MKTNSKKRMLVSSVAMLLVAMLSLGTATFAWFTNTTTAKADKAKVTVSAPSGLVIAAVTEGSDQPELDEYSSTIDLTNIASKSLTPVSGNVKDNTISFYEATVDNEKNLTKIATASNYIAIDIYARLSASNKNTENVEVPKTVNLASINATSNSQGRVVRCAYYGYNTTKSKVAYVHFGTGDRAVSPLKTTADSISNVKTNNNYVVETDTYIDSQITANTGFSSATAVGSAKFVDDPVNATKIGTIYLWVEGQDVDCNNANVDTVVGSTNDIAFNFALAE